MHCKDTGVPVGGRERPRSRAGRADPKYFLRFLGIGGILFVFLLSYVSWQMRPSGQLERRLSVRLEESLVDGKRSEFW